MKLKYLIPLMFLATYGYSQTATVTATITDPNGQAFANGTWSVSFNGKSRTPSSYNLNGGSFTQSYSGTLNGSGALSVTLNPNSAILPLGSEWYFQVCPDASAPCTTVSVPITGSGDISSTINASVPVILVSAGSSSPFARAYVDSEISQPFKGAAYYRVTDGVIRTYNGSIWTTIVGTGSGLADPGGNGVIKRTSLNVTAVVTSPDLIALWTGSCSSTTYLRGDGVCATPAGAGTTFQVSSTPLISSTTVNFTPGTGIAITNPSNGNVTFSVTTAVLADPGGNGIVKRTSVGVTGSALVTDVIALWSGACSSTTYLRGDGSCNTPSGTVASVSGATGQIAIGGTASNPVVSFANPSTTPGPFTVTGSEYITNSSPVMLFQPDPNNCVWQGGSYVTYGQLCYDGTNVQLNLANTNNVSLVLSNPNLNNGDVLAWSNGLVSARFQTLRATVGCTTGASVGATCTSSAQTWPVSYLDTNYTLNCTLDTPTGVPVVSSVTRSAASFTITIAALTAVGATGNYECRAKHD